MYLDLEPEVLARIAKIVGCDPSAATEHELINAILAASPSPLDTIGVFGAHARRALLWELGERTEPPPCIAILAALSLVAEQMKQTEEFAGSNYYGRLMRTLGVDEEHRGRVVRDFRKWTPHLWNVLNRWLEELNGRRGLPTATAFDHRRFIGLPLSQALIRAQDRTKLPTLFGQCGLQSGQRISVRAMQQLLAEWLPYSQVTPSLKRLWSRQGNRERISEVACAELEGWDGTVPGDIRPAEQKNADNLLVAIERRAHPHEEIDLFLVARGGRDKDAEQVAFAPIPPGATRAGLRAAAADLSLDPIPGTTWRSLEPSHAISGAEVLISNFSLASTSRKQMYSRRAKQLVLLKWLESEHLFVEARRAELLETYVVLAVSRMAETVRGVLQFSARAGFRELSHENLRGLPSGWIAFLDVQLERVPFIESDDLKSLQPIATTHLTLGGGLALPGMHVWHSERLPELRVMNASQDPGIAVSVRAIPIRYLDDRELSEVEIAEVVDGGIVELSTCASSLRDGDFRIVATCPPRSQTIATASIRVRSGSWPRRLESDEAYLLGYAVRDASSLQPLASRFDSSADPSLALSGALVLSEEAVQRGSEKAVSPSILARPGVVVRQDEPDELSRAERTSEHVEGDLPACFQRSYHHWLCETQVGREPVYSVCKDCGQEKWWEPKRRRSRKRRINGGEWAPSLEHAAGRRILPGISPRPRADMDLLLDALSYARGGSWRSLRAIAASLDDAPWFAREAARRLEALGHVEVEVNSSTAGPERWAIAPATIVAPEEGAAFLAGSRSARLLRTVAVACEILGGVVREACQRDGPAVVELHGLDPDDLQLVADEVTDHHGMPLRVSWRPGSRIAANLPSMSAIRGSLAELTMSASAMDRFDLEAGRWSSVDQLDSPGAYRLHGRPMMYAVAPSHASSDRRHVVADVRLAKYLAAKDASFSLLGYERATETLLASVGAPLPGLLERAAVLCSGRLPDRGADRTLAYARVPASVAEAIWTAASAR